VTEVVALEACSCTFLGGNEAFCSGSEALDGSKSGSVVALEARSQVGEAAFVLSVALFAGLGDSASSASSGVVALSASLSAFLVGGHSFDALSSAAWEPVAAISVLGLVLAGLALVSLLDVGLDGADVFGAANSWALDASDAPSSAARIFVASVSVFGLVFAGLAFVSLLSVSQD